LQIQRVGRIWVERAVQEELLATPVFGLGGRKEQLFAPVGGLGG